MKDAVHTIATVEFFLLGFEMNIRRAKLDGPEGDAIVHDVIRRGVAKANLVAEETLYLAKKAMKRSLALFPPRRSTIPCR